MCTTVVQGAPWGKAQEPQGLGVHTRTSVPCGRTATRLTDWTRRKRRDQTRSGASVAGRWWASAWPLWGPVSWWCAVSGSASPGRTDRTGCWAAAAPAKRRRVVGMGEGHTSACVPDGVLQGGKRGNCLQYLCVWTCLRLDVVWRFNNGGRRRWGVLKGRGGGGLLKGPR